MAPIGTNYSFMSPSDWHQGFGQANILISLQQCEPFSTRFIEWTLTCPNIQTDAIFWDRWNFVVFIIRYRINCYNFFCFIAFGVPNHLLTITVYHGFLFIATGLPACFLALECFAILSINITAVHSSFFYGGFSFTICFIRVQVINMIGVVNGDKYITWLSSHLLRNMSEVEIFQHHEINSHTSRATNKFLTGRHCDKLSLPKPMTSIPDRGCSLCQWNPY